MKLNFERAFWLVIFSIAIIGCEKSVDSTITLPAAKPFVTCYLSNSTSKTDLYFKRANSIYDYLGPNDFYGKISSIKDANVYINDGSQLLQLNYDTISATYRIDSTLLKIVKGRSYHVSIKQADGQILEASTTIPIYDPPEINYFGSHQGYNYSFDIDFTDVSSENRFFLLQFFELQRSHIIGHTDTVYVLLKSLAIEKMEDEHSVQKNISFVISPWIYEAYLFRNSDSLKIECFAINKDMYYFFNSLDANVNANGNAHASPSPVYSNFNEGDGIFGPVISK